MPEKTDKLGNHAIVIGGSIAGLLSARVLADKFERVTITERDQLPETPEARKGVPQSSQPHILFARGYSILEALFPEIGKELHAAGAIPIDWAREFHHYNPGGWNATAESASELVSFTCTRPLLEWTIRQQVSQLPNVRFLKRCRVIGLLCNPSRTQVTGISVRHLDESTTDELSAQLVVDASGRTSQAPHWIENLGFTPPPATVVNPFLGYATRRYRISPGEQSDWKVLLVEHTPPHNTRLGYLAQVEGEECIATLGGYGGDYPPLDNEEFLAFARSLPSPKFYETIRRAQPTSPIQAHRATANRMYHYERVNLPANFVALGDAVCALCPVYGQGMTVSAMSAMVLQDWLGRQKANSHAFNSFRFQKRLAQSNAQPWLVATGQDSRFPTTQGASKPSWFTRLFRGYTDRLVQRTHEDAELHTHLMEVAQMVKSPAVLFHPQVVLKTLLEGRRSESVSAWEK